MFFAWAITMVATFSLAYKNHKLVEANDRLARSLRVNHKVHNRLVRCVNQYDVRSQIVQCVWKQQ